MHPVSFERNPGGRAGQDREAQRAALDLVIDRALADSDAGRGNRADQVFDRLEAKYRAMASDCNTKSLGL